MENTPKKYNKGAIAAQLQEELDCDGEAGVFLSEYHSSNFPGLYLGYVEAWLEKLTK